ncbi:OPT family small oligopeptide transporter [Cryptococcus wingfieldii CBS 7118]|uniref:OPT family small oligopeptide transporter n=1 Tax=Cryptococcus wingfieldii CBS 7118 TaxID=1295528 RepID=A0A1E3J9C6_9TREE|nr:OPT family small oligopeptide transporter [Cryptococcus wingfieldii CBS 7118]ODN97275.1 OPT family small oligopeptide transporter [Cryptococcus wingfieldii CBS 7118]
MPADYSRAEAYELPPISPSAKRYSQEQASLDDPEDARLLDPEAADKDLEGDLDEDPASYIRRTQDEEVVGKGGKTVPSHDDPSLPTLTLRVLVLGISFCALGACASQIFYFKSNAPSFSSYFVILATYPLGHLLANERLIRRGKTIFGWQLNPGKFSIKEAILVSVLSSSGASSAYAADILAIMDLYFDTPLSRIPSIMLLLTTQCIGFGMLQNILVSPPAMYWPSTLVTVQLFTTLYSSTSVSLSSAQKLLTRSRLRLFMFVFLVIFLYQFLPFLLFPTLTSVSVLCLVDNESWWFRTLGSAYSGLGMGDFSFDWSSVGSSGPLYTPYWALGNYFGGLVGMIWVITPIILFTNFWNARDFPTPVSAGLFNSTFQKFDVTSILKPDLSLDEVAFEMQKPLLLTPFFALSYGISFAALSSVLVHVWLWHRDEIKDALSNRTELNDAHNKLMRAYRAVPSSWYLGLLAVNFGAAVILVKTTPLQMPIWALMLAMAIATLTCKSVGIITAVSNTQIGLNVLTEFVAGILMPGKPVGNVTFKCYGYMAMSQALALTSDLKLGWYTSIPPREMFCCQIIGTVIGALVNYATLESVLSSKRPYLTGALVDPTAQWTGRAPSIFYSASIIWGAVAPARFFSGGYEVLYLGFLVGAVVPVGLWLAHRRWPRHKLNNVVLPIICSGATVIPQYPTNIILTSLLTAVFVNSWFAKRYPQIHSQYIYVISSALDAGTSITALAIYILFGGVLWNWQGWEWWGNSGVDSEHCVPAS